MFLVRDLSGFVTCRSLHPIQQQTRVRSWPRAACGLAFHIADSGSSHRFLSGRNEVVAPDGAPGHNRPVEAATQFQ